MLSKERGVEARMDHQARIDYVSSNLPSVIQKLEKVLSMLKSVVQSEDANSRKWQLYLLSNPINDPAVLDLLYKITVKRRSSIDFHKTSYANLGNASLVQQSQVFHSPRKPSCESSKPTSRLPPITKSKSYHSEVDLLGHKPENQGSRRASATLPEPLPLSSKSLLFEGSAHGGKGPVEKDSKKQDFFTSFSVPYGDGEQAIAPPADECEHEGIPNECPDVWEDISRNGLRFKDAMTPIEESFPQWQQQLECRKNGLLELLLVETKAKVDSQDSALLAKDQEILSLKENHDKAMLEIDEWKSVYEHLKAKIAGKEKECYELRRKMDEKMKENPEMNKEQVVRIHLWNVEIAMKLCKEFINSKSMPSIYAMKSIVMLAKSAKDLEQQRPWTS